MYLLLCFEWVCACVVIWWVVAAYRCSVIALGNGTACRETETVISDCIKKKLFDGVQVKYSIVNEDGSSVYSVSELGEKELPHLDQNLRSAGNKPPVHLSGLQLLFENISSVCREVSFCVWNIGIHIERCNK